MECQNIWKSNRDFFFFFLMCTEREDEHLEIVQVVTECWCQKVLSAGCGYFQQWPHAPGTLRKCDQFDQGWHTLCLKPEVAEWSAQWWEQTASGWHWRVVWATSGESYIEETTRNMSRRWNIGAAGGECYGRKYWGRYCQTPVYCITNISIQEATSSYQQFHHGWFTCFDTLS